MKTLIQLFLFSAIIIFVFFFYTSYFSERNNKEETNISKEKLEQSNKNIEQNTIDAEKKTEIIKNEINKESKKIENANSSIQNLSYKVKLPDDKEYEIIANSSELSYQNNAEIILMNNVVAKFIDKNERIIKIEADQATFNNTNYYTNFNNNVRIQYLNNIITSDTLNYNFETNEIFISDNIFYQGIHGTIVADNILINILSKDIKVFMNNPKDKIKIKSN